MGLHLARRVRSYLTAMHSPRSNRGERTRGRPFRPPYQLFSIEAGHLAPKRHYFFHSVPSLRRSRVVPSVVVLTPMKLPAGTTGRSQPPVLVLNL